ncbi:hypothetical protein AO254_14650 [Pseudomonas syringae]|nr:hypothetical protein AO254_14650 [Pseudomonas syringae]
MKIVAFHVADQLAIEVELMQVTAAVIEVIQVLAGGQGQGGQVAERIVLVGKCALGCGLFDEAAEQVVGKFQFSAVTPSFQPRSAGLCLIDSSRSPLSYA